MQSSILRKYLYEDDYSQNLFSRQEEIDDVLINYIQVEWAKEREIQRSERESVANKSVIRISKLYNLRKKIKLTPKHLHTPEPIFRDVLQKSKQMVSDWRGKMYFVYLPSFFRSSLDNEHKDYDFVMQTVIELDIPIINIHSKVFDPHPDPLSLFPFRVAGHYNAEGYRLVAESIRKQLEVDNYVPIKLKKY